MAISYVPTHRSTALLKEHTMIITRVTSVTIAALCLVPSLAPNLFAADVPLIPGTGRSNPTHVTVNLFPV